MKQLLQIAGGVLLASLAYPTLAGGRPLTEVIADAGYWRRLDWTRAPDSAAWQDHNWVNYLGKQSPTETRSRIQAFRLEGSEWQATLGQRTDRTDSPYQLTLYTPAEDPQQHRCDTLYHWATAHFGEPRIAVDGSYGMPATAASAERRYIDRHYQWDLGNTRITQDCIGQFSQPPEADPQHVYAASSMRFSPLAETPEIHPLVNVHCSRQLRLTDSSGLPLRMSDIAFVVDENTGSIRRPDLVPIRVRNVQVTRDQVHFTLTIDKSTNDYRIDLPSGQMSATMTVSGIRAGEATGQCTLAPVLTALPR